MKSETIKGDFKVAADATMEALLVRVQRLEDESTLRRLMTDMMHTADNRDVPDWGERMSTTLMTVSGPAERDLAMSP